MGDRTKIADARQHDAKQAAGVIEQAMRIVDHIDKAARLMGEIITEALDAAGFDVVLRADPDTSDELAAEARRLLDAATPGPWASTGGGFAQPAIVYAPGYEVIEGEGAARIAMCEFLDAPERRADAALIAAAPRLIAALLERAVTAEADLRALSTRTTGDSKVDLRMLYAYEAGIMERDAERAARERAEAEARQLREAIRAHENLHRPDGPDGADGPIEMDGWPCCNDDRLLWAAAVAEVAEDRGQTDG